MNDEIGYTNEPGKKVIPFGIVHILLCLFPIISASGCSAMKYVIEAHIDPPSSELVSTSSGEMMDLYSVDTGSEPRDILFFVSGSGCISLNYFLRSYFNGLTGSWRIYAAQKSGVGANDKGIFCNDEFKDNANYDRLMERNRLALEKVVQWHGPVLGVVGVSEGGLIAAKLAQANRNVCNLVVIGDGGLSFRASAKILDDRQGKNIFSRAFSEVDRDPHSVSKSVLGHTHKYWSSFLDLDPAPVYLSITQPIFVIHGERDDSVPVESAKFMGKLFKEAKKDNLEIFIVPDGSHALKQNGVDKRPEIMGLISDFLQVNKKSCPGLEFPDR